MKTIIFVTKQVPNIVIQGTKWLSRGWSISKILEIRVRLWTITYFVLQIILKINFCN